MATQRLTVFAGPHDVLFTDDIDAPEVWSAESLRDLGSVRLGPLGPVPLATVEADGITKAVYLGREQVPQDARRLGHVPAGVRWLTAQIQLPFHGVPLRTWIGPDLFIFQHLLDPPRAWLLPYLLALPMEPVEQVGTVDGPTHRFRIGANLYCFDGHDRYGERLFGAGVTPGPRLEYAEPDEPDRIGHILSVGAIRL